MGSVQVRAWQAAYRGLMPDEYLDGLVPAEREAMWANAFDQPRHGQLIFVVEEGGAVRGFAAAGPEGMRAEETATGELYAINIDPSSWGRGLGGLLLRAVEGVLQGSGYLQAVLWVLPGNDRAISFYQRAGWTADGSEKEADALGVAVREVRYRRQFPIA